jgi:phospholipid/cholesterol/gamma-HCH transport system permease protein
MIDLAELRLSAITAVEKIGAITLFTARVIAASPRLLLRPSLVVAQVYNTGALSLVIIMLSGLFVGMVLALTAFDILQRYGSDVEIGAVSAIALVKELGPVVTALLFAGRAGTAVTSEIGLMKATDQLDALEMMAVDPVARVCAPRFLGGIIAMPLLAAVFSMIGLFGAQLIGVHITHVDAGEFWSELQSAVKPRYVLEGVWKSCAFGIACSAIAVFEGFHAVPTAEGVGRATTRTVVNSSVMVLLLDYILTAISL